MVKLFTHPKLSFVQHIRLLLQSRGVETSLRNEFIQANKGAFPLNETWPELWLGDESLLAEAQQILKEALSETPSTAASWRCSNCSEEVEGQFTECWHCGSSHS